MYGPFGSASNPLVAFDVVNEVIADSATEPTACAAASGTASSARSSSTCVPVRGRGVQRRLRRRGRRPAGDALHQRLQHRAVRQAGRLHALVERLLARGVPVDGVGHQFHVSLSMPVGARGGPRRVRGPAGHPGGHRVRRDDRHAGRRRPAHRAGLLLPRRVPGVPRARGRPLLASRCGASTTAAAGAAAGAPLIFDDGLQAKPAYYGAVDGELAGAAAHGERLRGRRAARRRMRRPRSSGSSCRCIRFGDVAVGFQLRWAADHLTAYVEVDDASRSRPTASSSSVDDATYTFGRDGTGDVPGVVDDERRRLEGGRPPAADRRRRRTTSCLRRRA